MIKISKKSDYAIASLSYILGATKPVSAKQIATDHHFPAMMISKVMKTLAQGGIVEGTRGISGGYVLKMKPEKITLGFIIEIMDGPLQIVECCSMTHECAASSVCRVRYSLQKVQQRIYKLFESITLKELNNQNYIGEL